MAALDIAILGATGRMGQALVRAIASDDGLRLAGAATRPGSAAVGQSAARFAGVSGGSDAGETLITADIDEALASARVAVDFSLPPATAGHARACRHAGCSLVIGTTGLDEAGLAALSDLAATQAVVQAANTSVGVALAAHLLEIAASVLGEDYDAGVFEAHHRHKLDAPSGTALSLGRAIADGRGQRFEDVADLDESGQGARSPGRIGFASLRGGDIVGDHRALFAGDGEVLEIAHRATSREVFARGALRAARWVTDQPPGLYGMADVLGLKGWRIDQP